MRGHHENLKLIFRHIILYYKNIIKCESERTEILTQVEFFVLNRKLAPVY